MRATKTCVAAKRFQYDYLNDDITDDGEIDYSLTDKMPQGLRDAIVDGKKLLVLINPPYAESTNSDNTSKEGVTKTKVAKFTKEKYGKASNELFMKFVSRIALEMPKATIGMFSTMKYINAPTLDEFRENWKANFIGGFVVHSKIFDGLKGNFPIGFLIWKTNQNAKSKVSFTEISVGVLDKNAHEIGDKSFYNLPNNQLLTNWVERPKTNSIQVVYTHA